MRGGSNNICSFNSLSQFWGSLQIATSIPPPLFISHHHRRCRPGEFDLHCGAVCKVEVERVLFAPYLFDLALTDCTCELLICSPSARNAVRVPFGVNVHLRRNPHFIQSISNADFVAANIEVRSGIKSLVARCRVGDVICSQIDNGYPDAVLPLHNLLLNIVSSTGNSIRSIFPHRVNTVIAPSGPRSPAAVRIGVYE